MKGLKKISIVSILPRGARNNILIRCFPVGALAQDIALFFHIPPAGDRLQLQTECCCDLNVPLLPYSG